MNKIRPGILLQCACFVAAALLAACSQAPQDAPATAPQTTGAPTVDAAAEAEAQARAAANAGTLEPQYTATLAEGINFAKPGAPDFLVAASGLSGVESWGRWTDANLGPVVFRFRDSLPRDFTLKLTVRDFFGLNAAQQITVRIGGQEQHFVVDGKGDQSVELKFTAVDNADTLELGIPNVSGANGNDNRKIGLGLISMSVVE